MKNMLDTIKGIHPGFVLERELKKRMLGKGQFAISLGEFPQTLTAITKGKRRMNIPLAMKIENSLSLEEGFLMTLQLYYDIEQQKKKLNRDAAQKPDLSKIRKVLFWDTDITKIDWQKQKKSCFTEDFRTRK